MRDWKSCDIASITIRSTWTGRVDPCFRAQEINIEKWGEFFLASVHDDDRPGDYSERNVVPAALIDQLLAAHCEPLVSEPDPINMGLTPTWFQGHAEKVIDYVAKGYSEAGKQRFAELAGRYDFFCEVFPRCFSGTLTNHHPTVHVLIENTNGEIEELQTNSQHHFMVPWKLGNAWNRTFNAHVSRAVAALVPDDFMHKRLLEGKGIEYCVIWDSNALDYLLDLPERTIDGCSGSICSLLFTPDSNLLISGTVDNVITVWNADRWQESHCLDMPRAGVNFSVELAPDGTTFAFNDATVIKIAEVHTGRIVCELRGHSWVIRKLLFSPDGARLASEDRDGVRLWDLASGQQLSNELDKQLLGFSGNGIETGRREKQAERFDRPLVSADGRWRISVSQSGNGHQLVEAFNSDAKQAPRKFFTTGIRAIALAPNGRCIVTGHPDGHLAVWDLPHE